jgi:hypothetical protein
MDRINQLFEQFLRERTYINNVTTATREWYQCAWKAFTVARKNFDVEHSPPTVYARAIMRSKCASFAATSHY